MWKLCVEDDQGNKTTVNLVRDAYTIGRSQDNTVRLTERNISRAHARIHKNGGGWEIHDQSSYNGCFVNGNRICAVQRLQHGDLVQLGDYRLRVINESFEVADENTPTDVDLKDPGHVHEAAAPQQSGTLHRLIMGVGPTPGTEFSLEQAQVILGRGEECDISINHSSVSRVHAEIRRLDDGRRELVDRESANGLRINGKEQRRRVLQPQDVIELGDITLTYVPADAPPEPLPAAPEEPAIVEPVPVEQPSPAQDAPAPVPPIPTRDFGLKLAAAAVLIGVAAIVAFTAFSGGNTSEPAEPTAKLDTAARALDEANALLARGKIEAAHVRATAGIPEQHALRESADFRDIEAQWADLVLAQAAKETDPERKRALFDQVARTTTVDSTRRKRAADRMAALATGRMDVSDLPHAEELPATEVLDIDQEAAAQTEAAAVALAPAEVPRPRAPIRRALRAQRPRSPAPPVAPKPPADDPKPPNVAEKATSGDRAAQIAAKNALKAKVAAGKGTPRDKRLLRALCRQHNDPSCVN